MSEMRSFKRASMTFKEILSVGGMTFKDQERRNRYTLVEPWRRSHLAFP
jgi:hypothetical protein